jgi:hypothetical protein
MTRRCLILGCSRTKVDTSERLPAIQRYNGPAYRVIRRFLREASSASESLDIFILSAEFGLITADTRIPAYDRLMTVSRADELRPQVLSTVQDKIGLQPYSEIFLSMSKTYLRTLAGIDDLVHEGTEVVVSNEASGRQLTELKQWLWGLEERPVAWELPFSDGEDANIVPVVSLPTVQPKTTARVVVLRGRQIRMTTAAAISRLKHGLCEHQNEARKIRSWYVNIEGEKVSPKWAAQYLFGLPTSKFSAEEARRALQGLGLNCYKI